MKKKKFVVFDLEADSLEPEVVWCLVCKDVDTGKVRKFLRPDQRPKDFQKYAQDVDVWIGHNVIQFDIPVLQVLCGATCFNKDNVLDTLVLSRLEDFEREGGHSLENWGEKIGFEKQDFHDFSKFSFEMLRYCERDVDVTLRVYQLLSKKMQGNEWKKAIALEHEVQWICREMHENGFAFNCSEAEKIRSELQTKADELDLQIQTSFPPRSVKTDERTVKARKDGTVSSVGLSWYQGNTQTDFIPGSSYSILVYEPFNTGSPKQIVERLHEAGWSPVEKTKTHKEWEKFRPKNKEERALKQEKLAHFQKYGWQVNETNLSTLPDTAPEGARLLVERMFVASRLRTLEEWFQAYQEDGRIHGQYNGIGTWTGRMSHVKPNTGNIAAEKSLKYSSEKLSGLAKEYGKRMRSLWVAPEGRLLVGTDAEGIQLRILGHYLKNQAFIDAIVNGKKEDKTDVHSVNQRAIGDICRTRDDAKTFIYALLLGAGVDRIAGILKCSRGEGGSARERFIKATTGFAELKDGLIKQDASRGFFIGLDGRPVACDSEPLMLAGYLQGGEATIMKLANTKWIRDLKADDVDFKQVNFIHDEWQTEVPNDKAIAEHVGKTQAKAIEWAGLELGVLCPLAGSFDIGGNWYETH